MIDIDDSDYAVNLCPICLKDRGRSVSGPVCVDCFIKAKTEK